MSKQELVLTEEEWAVVHDALAEAGGIAEQNAVMWKGRTRESRYRAEAKEIEAIRRKVDALLGRNP